MREESVRCIVCLWCKFSTTVELFVLFTGCERPECCNMTCAGILIGGPSFWRRLYRMIEQLRIINGMVFYWKRSYPLNLLFLSVSTLFSGRLVKLLKTLFDDFTAIGFLIVCKVKSQIYSIFMIRNLWLHICHTVQSIFQKEKRSEILIRFHS